jgi:hypothetical protein
MKAKIVNVKIEEGKTGLFFASSSELKGLLVAKPTLDALEVAIPQAITDLYAACGVEVVVSKVEDHETEEGSPWVAFPAPIAREALRVMAG